MRRIKILPIFGLAAYVTACALPGSSDDGADACRVGVPAATSAEDGPGSSGQTTTQSPASGAAQISPADFDVTPPAGFAANAIEGAAQGLLSGWDPGMKRRCVRSPFPGQPNYFEDTAECASDGKSWTLAVQSDANLGQSCSGVNGQSLPINSPGSPIAFDYLRSNTGWAGHISTNLVARSHPCGRGLFTWVTFMDHVGHGGGPLPRPDTLRTSVVANFSSSEPSGFIRFIVGWQGYWDGKSFSIEIDYYQSEGWDDNHPAEDIVTFVRIDEGKPTENDFVALDARHMAFARPVERG